MIFKLTAINCRVSQSSYNHLLERLAKVDRRLQWMEDDLVVFRATFRQDIDRYHPKIHPRKHKSYVMTKPTQAYFEGSMGFRIGKKAIYADFKGQTIDECIDSGFDQIFKEIEKYKDLHIPSDSDYPDQRSVSEVE